MQRISVIIPTYIIDPLCNRLMVKEMYCSNKKEFYNIQHTY